jgi:hypothetical protein
MKLLTSGQSDLAYKQCLHLPVIVESTEDIEKLNSRLPRKATFVTEEIIDVSVSEVWLFHILLWFMFILKIKFKLMFEKAFVACYKLIIWHVIELAERSKFLL